jgi:hypothetical protein
MGSSRPAACLKTAQPPSPAPTSCFHCRVVQLPPQSRERERERGGEGREQEASSREEGSRPTSCGGLWGAPLPSELRRDVLCL